MISSPGEEVEDSKMRKIEGFKLLKVQVKFKMQKAAEDASTGGELPCSACGSRSFEVIKVSEDFKTRSSPSPLEPTNEGCISCCGAPPHTRLWSREGPRRCRSALGTHQVGAFAA